MYRRRVRKMAGMDFSAKFSHTIDNEAVMEIAKKKGGPVVKEKAYRVLEVASSNAPVLTGNLRDSGHVVEKEEGVVYEVVFDAKGDDGGDSYARWVEEGTSKMDAQPYLRPAILAAKDK
jgi:HK97 gp10 family phage protein